MFQKIRTAGAKLAAVPALALIGVSSAYAELPTEVSTAVTEYKTDALAAIGMVLAAGVAIWGLRKLGTKLGWF
ncbi:hypothetical protein GCM10022279_17850 [Comamonas faecalis]|uniref:Phage coat protein n=1 Tax=Comamonas faecalis TaxID=1387849 RepID=A0ABP7RA22_9BURK